MLLHVKEEVVEENLIRFTFNVTIVRSIVIMLVIVLKTKEIIKKMMQDLQDTKKNKRCY